MVISLISLLGTYRTRTGIRKIIKHPNGKYLNRKGTLLTMNFNPNNPNDSLTLLRARLGKETATTHYKRATFEITAENQPPVYLQFYDEAFTLRMSEE